MVVLAIAILRLRADGRRLEAATIFPIATIVVFGVLGIATGRGLAWWALAAPVAAATLAHQAGFAERLPQFLQPARALFTARAPAIESRGSPLNAAFVAVLILAAVALLPIWRPVGAAGVPIGVLIHAPQGIAAELRTMVSSGQLEDGDHVWNSQTWGSWLEWAAPQLTYAVDSRVELFPADLLTDARQLESGIGEWQSIVVDKYPADAIVVAKTQNPEINAVLDASPLWDLAYSDADGSIFLRTEVEAGN